MKTLNSNENILDYVVNQIKESCKHYIGENTTNNMCKLILKKFLPTYKIDCYITITNISPLKSLKSTVFECLKLFESSTVVCSNCSYEMVFDSQSDIPFSYESSGQLVCPKCKQEWLSYQYEE